MEKHKKKLEELQGKLSGILHEVEHKRLSHVEAANRVVEIREEMDELIREIKGTLVFQTIKLSEPILPVKK